jgi:hypothetical protein
VPRHEMFIEHRDLVESFPQRAKSFARCGKKSNGLREL